MQLQMEFFVGALFTLTFLARTESHHQGSPRNCGMDLSSRVCCLYQTPLSHANASEIARRQWPCHIWSMSSSVRLSCVGDINGMQQTLPWLWQQSALLFSGMDGLLSSEGKHAWQQPISNWFKSCLLGPPSEALHVTTCDMLTCLLFFHLVRTAPGVLIARDRFLKPGLLFSRQLRIAKKRSVQY